VEIREGEVVEGFDYGEERARGRWEGVENILSG